MALVSPPKPWQRSQPENAQPAVTPASPVTASDQPQVQQQLNSTTMPPSQPSSYGYRQSSIGYSPYTSSSMYGSGYGAPYNSMYGGFGSSYGAPYGSSYGSSFAGSAYSPMYNQWGTRPYNSLPFDALDPYKGTPVSSLVNSGHAFMSGMQQHVSTFGRFSQILHMNLDALQMSFSSLLQLLTNASMLRHELSAFFGTFGSIRAIYLLYIKLRNLILGFVGRKNEARKLELEGLWQETRQGRWGWMPTFLTLSLSLLILRRIFQFVMSRHPEARRLDSGSMDPSNFWQQQSRFDQRNPWQPPLSSSMGHGTGFPSPSDPTGSEMFSNAFDFSEF